MRILYDYNPIGLFNGFVLNHFVVSNKETSIRVRFRYPPFPYKDHFRILFFLIITFVLNKNTFELIRLDTHKYRIDKMLYQI